MALSYREATEQQLAHLQGRQGRSLPHTSCISSLGAANNGMLLFKTTNLPYTKENNSRKHANVASKKMKVAYQAGGLTC